MSGLGQNQRVPVNSGLGVQEGTLVKPTTWSKFPAIQNVNMDGYDLLNVGNLEANFKEVGNLNVLYDATIGNATFVNDIYGDSAVFRELDITERGFIGLGNLQISSEDYPQFDTQQPLQGGDGMLTIGAQNVQNVLSQTANLIGVAVVMNTPVNNTVLGNDQYSVNMAFGNRAGVGQIYGAIGGYDGRANTGQGFRGGLKFYTKSGQGGQDFNAFRDTNANPVGSGLMGCKMKLTDVGSLLIAQETDIKQPQAKLHVDGQIIYDARVINLSNNGVLRNDPPTANTTLAETSNFRNGYYAVDIEFNWKADNFGGGTTGPSFGSGSSFRTQLEVDGSRVWSHTSFFSTFSNEPDRYYHVSGVVQINGSSTLKLLWGDYVSASFMSFGNTSTIKATLAYIGE